MSTYYRVKASSTVRYLGFYINHKLNCTRHVEIMCNRSIKSLQILGNSIRGINFAQWRLVYNAASLVLKLRRLQNEAARIISGSFSAAPCDLLHQILSILRIDFHFDMLTINFAL
ncbi:hypothetical protein BJV74DRAFT_988582, partial [Russula compacta]